MLFRKVIRPMLRSMGMDLVRHGPNRRFAPMLRAKWMNDHRVDLAIDIGANIGDYGEEIRHYGYMGRLISFEPVRSTFDKLQNTAQRYHNWEARHAAAGPANGRMTMNLSSDTLSSSLLPMLDRHANAAPQSRYVATEEVEVLTLDSLIGTTIKPTDRVWLKMDAQGYEFSILEGCKKLLPQVVGLELELSVVPLYEGTPLIEDALTRVTSWGFRTAMLDELFWDPDTKAVLEVDGIFLREKPAPAAS